MKLSESISKPARYTGGEYGAPDTSKPFDTSVCLCFPDVYEVGMSNLGTRILYFLMNGLDGVVCERCYAPWTDYADFLRDEGSPLVSLENKKPFKDFDFVGFSLQYELSYSNMLPSSSFTTYYLPYFSNAFFPSKIKSPVSIIPKVLWINSPSSFKNK